MDHRYTAYARAFGFQNADERRMLVELLLPETEEGEVPSMLIPFTWSVCDTCDGKGKYVNPDIDSQGLSREDFDDDPTFKEDYFAGFYDIQCAACKGKRMQPEPTPQTAPQKAFLEQWYKARDEEMDYATQCRREAEMGY